MHGGMKENTEVPPVCLFLLGDPLSVPTLQVHFSLNQREMPLPPPGGPLLQRSRPLTSCPAS